MTDVLKLKRDVEYEFPLDRFYWTGDPGHIWALKQEDGTYRIGIDSYTVTQAGEILSVRMRPVGKVIKQGKTLATVETSKWIGVIKSPFTAKITEVNKSLEENPKILNEKPYEEWLSKIEPTKYDEEKDSEYLIQIGDKEKLIEYMESEFEKYGISE